MKRHPSTQLKRQTLRTNQDDKTPCRAHAMPCQVKPSHTYNLDKTTTRTKASFHHHHQSQSLPTPSPKNLNLFTIFFSNTPHQLTSPNMTRKKTPKAQLGTYLALNLRLLRRAQNLLWQTSKNSTDNGHDGTNDNQDPIRNPLCATQLLAKQF